MLIPSSSVVSFALAIVVHLVLIVALVKSGWSSDRPDEDKPVIVQIIQAEPDNPLRPKPVLPPPKPQPQPQSQPQPQP